MTDSIEDARQRARAAGEKLDRYIGVWMLLWSVLLFGRVEHFIETPWLIVSAPLWFGPALWLVWRLLRFALFVIMTIVWLLFNFEQLARRR